MASSYARNKRYSDSLCTALDTIGANQWMRRRYYEYNAIGCIAEELVTLHVDKNGIQQSITPTTHIFGSSIEGTTTYGMQSDMDHILVETTNVVEQGFEGSNVADDNTVVVVTDMFTPPGFVKLKVDEKNCCINFKLQQVSDRNCFMSNIYTYHRKQQLTDTWLTDKEQGELERHGPALMSLSKNVMLTSNDIIEAFRSNSWLSNDIEFFNRPRHHGWPSQESLDIMKSQGCLLVPTGHHSCKEEHRMLQWRISFSFQERHLMLNLNTTQYKCYVLLKLVKKHHISPIMDLTSYHCKTSLLYTIENTDVEIWKEDNNLKCFVLCLKRIKKWSRKRMCPSYFVPELNLFTGKIEEQELRKLTHILTNIIRSPQHYLQQISTDNFGTLFEIYTNGSTDDGHIEEKMGTQVEGMLHILLLNTASKILQIRSNILLKISYECSCLDMAIERHYNWLNTIQHLQRKSNIGTYQLYNIHWALPHVCRFLHSSLASHLALKVVKSPNTQMKTWHILSVAYHFWMGLQSDAYSGKMKLATFLFYTGYLSADELKSNYWSTLETKSICACSRYHLECVISGNESNFFQNLCKTIETMKMSASVYIEKYVSACTIFLPTESELTLYPLKFEMHRSFSSKQRECDMVHQTHFKCNFELDNCATLDSKVYYVLLMIYLSGKKERDEYITMLYNCSADDCLEHRETTWNVLGYYNSTEEINQKSLICYKRSWDYYIEKQQQKSHVWTPMDQNAAKWHMALLLYRAWFNN